MLAFALSLSLGCHRIPPEGTATAPRLRLLCPEADCEWWPSSAWLTVERDRKIVGWTAVELFPDEVFDVRSSEDGVEIVVGIHEPHFDPIHRAFKQLLAEEGVKLTMRRFRKALRRGQITCHGASVTWPQESYVGIGGTDCFTNLLFSMKAPPDTDHLLPHLGLMKVRDAEEVMAGDPPEATPRLGADSSAFEEESWLGYVPELAEMARSRLAREESRTPQAIGWEELRPILQDATEFSKAEVDGKTIYNVSMCIENVSPERLEASPDLVDAVVVALVQFLQSNKGRAIVGMYNKTDNPHALWEDPCLPGTLKEFLQDEKVVLLMSPTLDREWMACLVDRDWGAEQKRKP